MVKNILHNKIFELNKFIVLGLLLLPITLIINIKLNVISIGVLTFGIIVDFYKKRNNKLLNKFSFLDLLVFFSFYLIQIIGVLYSTEWEVGLKHIETKFSFFLLPLIFILLFSKRKFKKDILLFTSTLLGITILIVFYFYLIPLWVFTTTLTLKELNGLIPNELAHVYIGMFSVFSFITFYFVIKEVNIRIGRIFLSVGMFLLFLIPLILTARVATFISILFLIYITISDKKNRKWYVYSCIFMVICFSIWAYRFPDNIKRFKNIFNTNEFYNPIYHRVNNVECAFNIFADNILLGVGTGSVQNQLNECYSRKKFWGLKDELNAHNEILEEAARHGVMGLAVIFFIFIYPLSIAFKQKNYFYIAFLFITLISMLTENIFSRQVGVVFFCFFNTLFYIESKSKYE